MAERPAGSGPLGVIDTQKEDTKSRGLAGAEYLVYPEKGVAIEVFVDYSKTENGAGFEMEDWTTFTIEPGTHYSFTTAPTGPRKISTSGGYITFVYDPEIDENTYGLTNVAIGPPEAEPSRAANAASQDIELVIARLDAGITEQRNALDALRALRNKYQTGSEMESTPEADAGAIALEANADALLVAAARAVKAATERGNEIDSVLAEIREVRAKTATV